MTGDQAREVSRLLSLFFRGSKRIFHFGWCEGADDQAAFLARTFGYLLVAHPGPGESKRGTIVPNEIQGDEIREPKSYLARNRDIVDESWVVIAAPKDDAELLRSGTWATIRYARKVERPLYIIWPDGTLKYIHRPPSKLKLQKGS